MSKTRKGLSIPIFLFLILIPAASPLSFEISPITWSGGSFNFSFNASIDGEGLQVTKNDNSLGRVAYKEPLHLWDKSSGKMANFTTRFSFVVDSNGNPKYAHGMAFFLAPVDTIPKKMRNGRNLGLGNGTHTTDLYVAVEFDTYVNQMDFPQFPNKENTSFPHVGIDINNITSVNATPWLNNVPMGPQNNASITYNADSKMLIVEFTGQNNSMTQQGSLSYKLDLRDHLPEYVAVGFSASTGDLWEQHIVKSWNFSSTLDLNNQSPEIEPNKTSRKGLISGLSGGLSTLLILALACAIFVVWKKKMEKEDEKRMLDKEFEQGTGPKKFSYKKLVSATNDFAERLGEGGFGGVYKGFLKATNTPIAVKKVSKGSKQGRKEYAAEVKVISRLRHVNLVQLLGWCHKKAELLLVYEFMPNGSLDSHLFTLNSLLTWEVRYKIAQGLASALLYLHEELEQYVLHRDIKASNVMLDANFNAKLGDFGLARLVDHDKDSHTTDIPAGTMGYMAPEYPVDGRASKETDIYSFGIVLLEIACGRRPIDHTYPENQIALVKWVWSLYEAGQLLDAVDARLDSTEFASKIERLMVLGLWCAHPDSTKRPRITLVMQFLNNEDHLPSLPPVMPRAMDDIR